MKDFLININQLRLGLLTDNISLHFVPIKDFIYICFYGARPKIYLQSHNHRFLLLDFFYFFPYIACMIFSLLERCLL
jgi:hypothetical protein